MTRWTVRDPNDGMSWIVFKAEDDFGITAYELLRPPRRFWGDGQPPPPVVRSSVDAARVANDPHPTELLRRLPDGDNWHAMSRRSLDRLEAWFLVAEDHQRRLEAREISTLAHQASLVQHVLSEPSLQHVMIADEVGLGKTIEAGLILQQLIRARKELRTLYLAPARLCRNVHQELRRLGLPFRLWVSGDEGTATLDDPRVVASIHRAAHPAHLERFVAQARWDVIVVDECHHLSDWAAGGGKPVRKYKLVDELRKKLPESGRLILLSGTPHQGHSHRFDNLLKLLRSQDEPIESLAGRVIYRTKEDVRGWDGKPLFPKRQVNRPEVVDLGDEHRSWLKNIHAFFEPGDGEPDNTERRAAGWRCGQALQWATSSIEAGMGYLVRQAIRAEWDLSHQALAEALGALRPYRQGPADEPIAQLFARVKREIRRQQRTNDVDDIEEGLEVAAWVPDEPQLDALLREGLDLLRSDPDRKWRELETRVLAPAGDEKVVLFAQPIETVTALAGYLERRTGQRPALIIGNQSEEVRSREIAGFWREDGPQYLVSSRAGGEGLNLQVSRRLVHVDVPWNPMELEQRVGRVHRFLSRRTVIVDTIVVEDSREVDMYDVARAKLHEIAGVLGHDNDRFEMLFSRVMSLVPPETLQGVLGERALGPLDESEKQRIQQLVHEGHARWVQFHGQYAERQREIRSLDPGEACWSDLAAFAVRQLSGEKAPGYHALRFRWEGDEVVEDSEQVEALRIGAQVFAVGDHGGMPVTGPGGDRAPGLGLNRPEVASALRRVGLPERLAGAAHVRWPSQVEPPEAWGPRPFAAQLTARVTTLPQAATRVETEVSLHAHIIREGKDELELGKAERAALVRGLLAASIRREPADVPILLSKLERLFARLHAELRRPSEEDRRTGARHGVFPLLACIVS